MGPVNSTNQQQQQQQQSQQVAYPAPAANQSRPPQSSSNVHEHQPPHPSGVIGSNSKGKEREVHPRNDSLPRGWDGAGGGGGGATRGYDAAGNHFSTLTPFQHPQQADSANPHAQSYPTYNSGSHPVSQSSYPPIYPTASGQGQPYYPNAPHGSDYPNTSGTFDQGPSASDPNSYMGGAYFGERMDSSGMKVITYGQLVPRQEDARQERMAGQDAAAYSFDHNRFTDSSWTNAVTRATSSGPRPQDYVSPDTDVNGTPAGSPHSSPHARPPIGGQASNVDSPFGTLELPASSSSRPPNTVRVRRSTYVPGWSAPPRVLVVDDDSVTAKLSSKFLEVFGCTTDVAVDGIGAVNKMNLEKYDRECAALSGILFAKSGHFKGHVSHVLTLRSCLLSSRFDGYRYGSSGWRLSNFTHPPIRSNQ